MRHVIGKRLYNGGAFSNVLICGSGLTMMAGLRKFKEAGVDGLALKRKTMIAPPTASIGGAILLLAEARQTVLAPFRFLLARKLP